MKYLNIILSVLLICSIIGATFSVYDFLDTVTSQDNGLYSLGQDLYLLLPLNKERYKNGFTIKELQYYEFALSQLCYAGLNDSSSGKDYFHSFCVPYLYNSSQSNELFNAVGIDRDDKGSPVYIGLEESLWHYYAYTYLPTWLDEYHRGEYIDVPAIDIFLKKYCTVNWKEFEAGSEPLRYLHFNWPRFKADHFVYLGDIKLVNPEGEVTYSGEYSHVVYELDVFYELIQLRIDLLVNSDLMKDFDIRELDTEKYKGHYRTADIFLSKDAKFYNTTVNYYEKNGKFRLPDYVLYKIMSSYSSGDFDINNHFRVIKEIPIYDYTLPY